MAEPRANPIAQAAYYAFLPLFAFFILYVGLGYYLTLSTTLPTLSKSFLFLIVFFIISLMYLFLRHTALAIHHARGSVGLRRFSWLPMFVILFAFSGYGFIAASMLLFEGPGVCTEAVSRMIASLSKLEATGNGLLRVPQFEETKSRVNAEREALHNEINNPSQGQYCGVGSSALAIIQILGQDLPGVEVIRGTTDQHACSNKAYLNSITDAYDKKIDAGLRNIAAKYGITEREYTRDTLAVLLSAKVHQLTEVQKRLAGIPNFVFDFSLYEDSLRALADAKVAYSAGYEQLRSFDFNGRT